MWVAWQLALSLSLESQENCQQASFTWASLDSKTYLMGVKDGGYKPLLFFFSHLIMILSLGTKTIKLGTESERRDRILKAANSSFKSVSPAAK